MSRSKITESLKEAILITKDGLTLGTRVTITVQQAGTVSIAGMKLPAGTYELKRIK